MISNLIKELLGRHLQKLKAVLYVPKDEGTASIMFVQLEFDNGDIYYFQKKGCCELTANFNTWESELYDITEHDLSYFNNERDLIEKLF